MRIKWNNAGIQGKWQLILYYQGIECNTRNIRNEIKMQIQTILGNNQLYGCVLPGIDNKPYGWAVEKPTQA